MASTSSSATSKMKRKEQTTRLEQIKLLNRPATEQENHEAINTPIFTASVLNHLEKDLRPGSKQTFPQYGLLAGLIQSSSDTNTSDQEIFNTNGNDAGNGSVSKIFSTDPDNDPRVFFNTANPSSTFICGSQGSGKSHTLSCLLENALIPSVACKLPHPLTGLVFHYDTFISDDGGSPCEAAFLASNPNIKVRILCAPTNESTIRKAYSGLKVTIEPLKIDQTHLNTKRMLDLMVVKNKDDTMPLYLHSVYTILRRMRLEQQTLPEAQRSFDYSAFKERIAGAGLSDAQNGPLRQRLDTLESFMPESQIPKGTKFGTREALNPLPESIKRIEGNDWSTKSGTLTIVDLSCPCVTPEGACALFYICLSLFLESGGISLGKVVALDEAHKYMNASSEASALTEALLGTVRLQRHLGARIIISTQEPTISPSLLELSSVTIVHRFTSPKWLLTLKGHLAGAASNLLENDAAEADQTGGQRNVMKRIFKSIVELRNGEALLFSPSALVGLEGNQLKRLGTDYLKVRVRSRITQDGGKSAMAE